MGKMAQVFINMDHFQLTTMWLINYTTEYTGMLAVSGDVTYTQPSKTISKHTPVDDLSPQI